MTGDQVELAGGTIVFQVQDPDAAQVEILTPSVSLKAYAEGVYRVSVRKTGESEITAQSGRTLVVAPAGEQWLEEGQKIIARGPRANPQYRIVSAMGWWRRLASLLQNMQIGGGGGGSVESGGGGGRETQAATAKESRSKPNESAAVSTGNAHANSERAKTSDSHSTTPSASAHSGDSRSTSSSGGGSASHASESHSAPASSSSGGSHSDTATRGK